MNARSLGYFLCACAAALFGGTVSADIGTAFTYQGYLENPTGEPVTDACSFRFGLWKDATGVLLEDQVGAPQTFALVEVRAGVFTIGAPDAAGIDFGKVAFDGTARWLEIEVQCSSDLDFVVLSPRVELTPAPHAIHADHAPWTGLADVPAGFADGLDADALGTLSCQNGHLAKWNEAGSQWECAADTDTDSDTLSALACAEGQVAKWNATSLQWTCAADIDTDSDTDTLADLSCANGQVPTWNQTTQQWFCATPIVGAANLDEAYHGGGVGLGRTITANAGAVSIAGPDGLTVSGKLGVGTATPAEKLDVAGNVHASGAIISGSTITIDGNARTITSDGILKLNAPGGVGIGTVNPTARIHIGGTPGVDGIRFPDNTLQVTADVGDTDTLAGLFCFHDQVAKWSATFGQWQCANDNNVPGGTVDGHSLDAADGSLVDVVYVDNDGWVHIGTSAAEPALDVVGSMQVDGITFFVDSINSRVGLGRLPTANRLEVSGSASKNTAGSWLANSDRRIKKNIETIQGALATLNRVNLVSFGYTDEYRAEHEGIDDRRYMNVIAQEFAEIFPDYVKGSGERLPGTDEEILQVDPYPLTIYAAAAVQELHKIVQQRDREIDELKARLTRLEQLLETIPSEQKGERQ